jgi:hypothetical protein
MRLSPLEKSHLMSLVRGESRHTRTTEDLRALAKLVKFGYANQRDRHLVQRWAVTKKGQEYTRVASNMFSKVQIALIKSRIASGKFWVPKVGQLIYTETHLYLGHGNDDCVGGLSQVTQVYRDMSGGDPKCVFVEVAQHDHGGNWTQVLFPDQKELLEEFGDRVAYADPDDRPQFNQG